MVNIGAKVGEAIGYALGQAVNTAVGNEILKLTITRKYPGYYIRDYGNQIILDPIHDTARHLLDWPQTTKVFIGSELFPGIKKIGPHVIIRLSDFRKRMVILIPENLHHDMLYRGVRVAYLDDYVDLLNRDSPA